MTHVFGEIIKSPADTRNYRGIELPNKLKVLLVNDPTTDKAAAAMSVGVGTMSDPPNLPGLAHFCEHMLFMGSQKFPTENDYDKFISDNGGGTNAYTFSDHTVYYFDVAPSVIQPALDRFAQFFISPLFTESAVEREVNAVHSEHEGNIPEDSNRIEYAIQLCSYPGHPYSFFGTGNRETLWNIPRKQGIDVRSALIDFHEKYYSSNIMALTVLGKESLDELQSIVENLFSAVKNKNIPMPFWPDSPYGPDNLPRLLEVTPIKEKRLLSLHFPIPYTVPFYKTEPDGYLSHLIGHEGPGSLLLLLKESKLASSLYCTSYELARGFAAFNIDIELTPEGLIQWEQVVQHVFEYTKMLREVGPQEWFWDELRLHNEIRFRFYNKKRPGSMVSDICPTMLDYNVEEVLSHSFTLTEYKPELITQFLDCLTPTNVLVTLVSHDLRTILVDEYYGVHYNITELPDKLIQTWKSCEQNSEFRLPLKNEFIPSKFTIKHRTEDKGCISPKIVMDTALSRVWFLQDMEFLLPKGVFYLELFSPLPLQSALNCSLNSLFERMLEDALQHELYPATLVGSNYRIMASGHGLSIYVDGYDHKLTVVMERIIHTLLNFKVDNKRFEIVKEKYVRKLRNWKDNEPTDLISIHLSHVMSQKSFIPTELLEIVKDLTLQNLKKYASQFLEELKLQYLFYGNWVTQDALSAAEQIEVLFNERGTRSVPVEIMNDVEMQPGINLLVKRETQTHSSSAALVFFQLGLSDIRMDVICSLLVQIFEEPFFDQLRTKECLGYTVNVHPRHSNGTNGLVLLVQGEKHPIFVETRIDNFLDTMTTLLENLTNEQFEIYKSALATYLAQKPQNIYERANLIWHEITSSYYNFTRSQMKLEQLKSITLNEIQTAYKNLISIESGRRLDIHVVSFAKEGAGNKQIDGNITSRSEKEQIDDLVLWKSKQTYINRPEPINLVNSTDL